MRQFQTGQNWALKEEPSQAGSKRGKEPDARALQPLATVTSKRAARTIRGDADTILPFLCSHVCSRFPE